MAGCTREVAAYLDSTQVELHDQIRHIVQAYPGMITHKQQRSVCFTCTRKILQPPHHWRNQFPAYSTSYRDFYTNITHGDSNIICEGYKSRAKDGSLVVLPLVHPLILLLKTLEPLPTLMTAHQRNEISFLWSRMKVVRTLSQHQPPPPLSVKTSYESCVHSAEYTCGEMRLGHLDHPLNRFIRDWVLHRAVNENSSKTGRSYLTGLNRAIVWSKRGSGCPQGTCFCSPILLSAS